jgi:hypothetical protein
VHDDLLPFGLSVAGYERLDTRGRDASTRFCGLLENCSVSC